MAEERHGEVLEPEGLYINKEIVIDSLKAVCLIGSWIRALKNDPGNGEMDLDDEELSADLEQWALLEKLISPDLAAYDQLEDPADLASIMVGLSTALVLSSDRAEYFEIRREWNKIGSRLKDGHGIDVFATESTFLEAAGKGLMPAPNSLQVLVEYMPELKQGWNAGGAEGVRDYLTVVGLGRKEKNRQFGKA